MSTTVFTCGCFDDLHEGHLYLLREARKLGDLLIVGLNSDDYIRRVKKREPIERAGLRAGRLMDTGLVDTVAWFDDSPLNLILSTWPDVIVTGDDYTEDQVVGGQEAKAWGGRVVRVPRLLGYSTTARIAARTTEDRV